LRRKFNGAKHTAEDADRSHHVSRDVHSNSKFKVQNSKLMYALRA